MPLANISIIGRAYTNKLRMRSSVDAGRRKQDKHNVQEKPTKPRPVCNRSNRGGPPPILNNKQRDKNRRRGGEVNRQSENTTI